MIWANAMPVKGMIPMLSSVIEDFSVLASKILVKRYDKTMSSRDLCYHSVPFVRLFKFVT